MIDKVIKLDNNLEYYVLDEMAYDEKNYLIGLQVDNEKEGITNNYIFVETIKDINGNVTLIDIESPDLLEKIGNMFIERLDK